MRPNNILPFVYGAGITLLITNIFPLVFFNESFSSELKGKGEQLGHVKSYRDCAEKWKVQLNCPFRLLENETEFNEYFDKIEGNCSNWKTFGIPNYGGLKYVCLDPKFNIKPGKCIVLSFGINNDWSFDDDIDKFNCKVYAFDPTVTFNDHNRSENIQFFKVGIGGNDGMQKVGMDNNWSMQQVYRYETILKRLGLEETPIDYIKMDVEYSELDFFMDVFMRTPHLLKNIKQIGMEIHHEFKPNGLGHKSYYQMFWAAFQLLRCHGFKLYHARNAGIGHEVVWVREDDW